MVSTSISYLSSFPNIPWDLSQSADPNDLFLAGQYENNDWAFNVTFTVPDPGLGEEESIIASVDVDIPSITVDNVYTQDDQGNEVLTTQNTPFNSVINYNVGAIGGTSVTVSFTGRYTGMFNEIFQFVMQDGSVRNLPINNKEDWAAVVRWAPPPSKEKLLSYTFTVVTSSIELGPTTSVITIPQYVYWAWQPSLATFKNFVSIGEL